jgi:hypothetical protein
MRTQPPRLPPLPPRARPPARVRCCRPHCARPAHTCLRYRLSVAALDCFSVGVSGSVHACVLLGCGYKSQHQPSPVVHTCTHAHVRMLTIRAFPIPSLSVACSVSPGAAVARAPGRLRVAAVWRGVPGNGGPHGASAPAGAGLVRRRRQRCPVAQAYCPLSHTPVVGQGAGSCLGHRPPCSKPLLPPPPPPPPPSIVDHSVGCACDAQPHYLHPSPAHFSPASHAPADLTPPRPAPPRPACFPAFQYAAKKGCSLSLAHFNK